VPVEIVGIDRLDEAHRAAGPNRVEVQLRELAEKGQRFRLVDGSNVDRTIVAPSGIRARGLCRIKDCGVALDLKEALMPKRSHARVAVARPRPHLLTLVLAAALLSMLAVLVVHQANAAGSSAALVRTSKGSLGRMLVDSRGRTLYLFEADRNGKSACSGACASYWPPLLTKGKPRAGAGVSGSRLGTIRRSGGARQVTYAGHPLYTFALDTRSGQTKGEGLDDFGGYWYAVAPQGRKLTSR
jgi:predicted lipoprotein with Yx(FWY)xxD motif